VKLESKYQDYALLMKALSDETRVKIFHMLSQGELCACKILEEFNITQPTLSYHMKILSDSGLVNSRRDGIWMKYTINKGNFEILKEFLNDIGAQLETTIICSTYSGKC
jgi:ArsR family transcriptional regulator